MSGNEYVFLEAKHLRKSFPSPGGGESLIVDLKHFSLKSKTLCADERRAGRAKRLSFTCWPAFLSRTKDPFILDGKEVSGMSEGARDRLRAESIGYVFQSFNLLQSFTCLENVLLAASFAGKVKKAWAKDLLDRVGLSPRADYYPRQLSIGQQQRVALARALANQPKLVLADEPTGNLDPKNGQKALSLLRELCRENGSSLLLVSHEQKVIESFEHQFRWEDLNQVSVSTEDE